MFCPNCGTQNAETLATCTKCGFNLKSAAPKFKGTMLMTPGAVPPRPTPLPVGAADSVELKRGIKGTAVMDAAPPLPQQGAPAPTPGPVAAPPAPVASPAPLEPAPPYGAPPAQPAPAPFGAPPQQSPEQPPQPLFGVPAAPPAPPAAPPAPPAAPPAQPAAPPFGAPPVGAGQAPPPFGAPLPQDPAPLGAAAVGQPSEQGQAPFGGAPMGAPVPPFGAPPQQSPEQPPQQFGAFGVQPQAPAAPGAGMQAPAGFPAAVPAGQPPAPMGAAGFGGGFAQEQPNAMVPGGPAMQGMMQPMGQPMGQAMGQPMGQQPMMAAGQGPVGTTRNPIVVTLISIICGFYWLYAGFMMLKELKEYLQSDDINPIFIIIPILNLIVMWQAADWTYQAKQRAGVVNAEQTHPVFYLVLGVYFLPRDLNEVWEAASRLHV